MDTKRLQAILDYNLTEDESKAYRMALIWEDLTKQMFPQEKGIARLPKGDPRKSSLFRFCWKLMRETRGLLRFDEYKMYIRANLTMIKVKNLHLSPNILCGDNAWIRWKIWKRLYEQKVLEKSGETVPPTFEIDPKLIKKLELTKRFIYEKCEGEPSLEKIQKFYDDKSLNLWAGNKIAYLYIVLSPWIQQIAPMKLLEREMSFDSNLYLNQIDDSIRDYFKQEFAYEF